VQPRSVEKPNGEDIFEFEDQRSFSLDLGPLVE
jgi:hypothetical protein